MRIQPSPIQSLEIAFSPGFDPYGHTQLFRLLSLAVALTAVVVAFGGWVDPFGRPGLETAFGGCVDPYGSSPPTAFRPWVDPYGPAFGPLVDPYGLAYGPFVDPYGSACGPLANRCSGPVAPTAA